MSIEKEDIKTIEIDLNHYDRIEVNDVFLENIEIVSKKINLDKRILTFYIINGGDIDNIVDGFKVSEGIKNTYTIEISNELSLKEIKLKEDLLYNFANYCYLKGFGCYTYFERNSKEAINDHDNIFDREIKISLNENYYGNPNTPSSEFSATLFIEYDKEEDVIPEGCCLELLEEEDEVEYYKFDEYLDDALFETSDSYYYFPFDIKFTDCLETNIKLIEDDIQKNYEWLTAELKKIKEGSRKYFKKQLIKKNIDNFK
jgi:hypothetical protein